ncbi:hypothetical protein JTB14_007134 [Gonioctena quinquepunctata]|nr:hypothetical protein JTB14_007134 [Gonioctena quinquepunctata]
MNLSLVWIPGHSGLEGNGAVDSPAKEEVAKYFSGPEPAFGIFPSFAKQTLNTWTARKVPDSGRSSPGLVYSKALINPSKNLINQLLRLTVNPAYRLSLEDDEPAEHILCACLAADRIRFSMFGRASLLPSDLKDHSPSKPIGFVKKLDLFGEI